MIVISGATNVINSLYGIAPLHERYTSLYVHCSLYVNSMWDATGEQSPQQIK